MAFAEGRGRSVIASPSLETMDESRQERLFAESPGSISPPAPLDRREVARDRTGGLPLRRQVSAGILYITRKSVLILDGVLRGSEAVGHLDGSLSAFASTKR